MRIRNIDPNIQIKIRRYIEYMHEEERSGFQKGELIMSSISKKLMSEVKTDIFYKILMQKKIFAKHFSKEFIKCLALRMVEKTFAPDETVFNV